MEKNKFNYTKLRGADLFEYITLASDLEDSDLKSDVELLAYALMPSDREQSQIYKLTERLVDKEIELVAYYPALEEVDTSSLSKIGEIFFEYRISRKSILKSVS